MKEKIEQLANGEFEYETPLLLLSENELQINVEAGSVYEGSFTIKNSKGTKVKGVLYSSSELFQLGKTYFTEEENVIPYCFHAQNMKTGESLDGKIGVISDCGEVELPFTVTIEIPYLPSSIGKIRDLFNFTNLAKTDWEEAIKLFSSEKFCQSILGHDTKYLLTYKNLLKSKSVNQALEEFLVTIRKKLYINISVEKNSLEYCLETESIMDKLLIKKDNWGYVQISVETDAPFLSFEHKLIFMEDFVGNTYPLEFILNPAFMRLGNNYGRIYLYTVDKVIPVEVFCKCSKSGERQEYQNRKVKKHLYNITGNYLNFRKNRISVQEYLKETGDAIDILLIEDVKNEDIYQLLRIHLLIISGKEEEAIKALKEYEDRIEVWGQSDIIRYCASLYLSALVKKDEETVERAVYAAHSYYEKEPDNWKLLWFLLYMDKKYDNYRAAKLEEIEKSYLRGCKSPILYYEALCVYREEPSLFHELGDFELQVMYWGIRNDYITEDLALQFTYLAGKQKMYKRLVHQCLSRLYENFKMKDTLFAICSHLIKGHQRHQRYFNWFYLGVKEQLRITEIHEYFMYTLDETAEIELPRPILLYFIYNSDLSDKKKAFLYAYIIKRKESHQALYLTYYKRMEQFALKQLSQHMISANLSIIYQEIISEEGLTPEIGRELPHVMFKHELVCRNPNIKGAFVVHKEQRKEVYCPFSYGVGQVDVFTENAEIFLVDMQDNRYSTTFLYTINKLMPWEYYIGSCFEMGIIHPMIILNLSEKVQNYQKYDEASIAIRKKVLEIEDIEKEYYNKNLLDLIHYYYDNFEGGHLDSYLSQIVLSELETSNLEREERNKIIEFFIIREMYDKAFKALKEYGFGEIAINRLMKLDMILFRSPREEVGRDEFIAELSHYIFKAGKYNEDILKYLVKYFQGTTEEMYFLWQAAAAFEMETTRLEERLLGQMLFAKSYLTNSASVFLSYYKKGTNHKLIRAFLSYNAYKYLVSNRVTQTELFDIMKRELAYEENEVCLLAVLKYLSTKNNLTDAELNFMDYNINSFIRKGLILPFFKKLQTVINLPPQIRHKFLVKYITNPGHAVTIHYRLEGKNNTLDFVEEEMKDVYLGIRVKEFVLFYNENVQYYITEKDEEGNISITESVNLKLGQDMEVHGESRYNQLNFLLMAMDMQDDKTLVESLEDYIKNDYVIKRAFKPLD